jgi:hypothetical protein
LRLSPVGDQILSSREDILKECATSEAVYFNLYLAPSDNLFCSLERLNDEVLREGYSLDGKNEEQSLRVIENLIRLFSQRAAKHVAFGLVADRYAELHRDFHWDDFFVGSERKPPEWPLVMGFSSNFPKLKVIPDGLYGRTAPGANCVLFRKAASPSS